MKDKNKIVWTIEPLAQPNVRKRCSKCGQDAKFINSGKFRVNANKKHLDIWLIYQCERCKSTYNLTVHERISPQTLPNETLEQFMRNDPALASQIGFDAKLHAKNNVVLDLAEVPIQINGDLPETLMGSTVEIHCTHGLGLRVDKILSQKLSVSRESLKKECIAGQITLVGGGDLLKEKIKNRVQVYFSKVV